MRPTDEMAIIAMATPLTIERNFSMIDSAVLMPKLLGSPKGTWRRTRRRSVI
jgi:hypothetical protein